MNVTETRSEGLSREFQIDVTAAEIDERVITKLEGMKGQIHIKGFRPGKAPVSYLKKAYGKSLRGEIVQELITETSSKALEERDLRAAQQPKIDFVAPVEDTIEQGTDLSYKMEVELMPDFEPVDFSTLKIEKPVAEATDDDIAQALDNIAEQQKTYETKDGPAEDGDQVKINFVGRIDGEPFEGGSADDMPLVLGSGHFIPGFEEQLMGAKAGDDINVKVSFPDDYQVAELKGKAAEFETHVNEVGNPQTPEISDELATKLGVESLDALKGMLKERIERDLGQYSRERMKRTLLDKLDELHDFELPQGMVDGEFDQIWHQLGHAMEHEGKTWEDEDQTEDEAREEYKKIAERRVRLGLLLGEIGRKNDIQVTQDELTGAIAERARQFPGQEQQVYKFYTENPQALNEVQAPLFEDKVIDYIAELAEITEVTVSKDELMKDPDEEAAEEKETKKKPAKKTKAKAKKDDAE